MHRLKAELRTIQSGVALRWPPQSIKTKTAPPKIKKGWNGQRLAVSPFDGVNRIRFKGSLDIADLRLPIDFAGRQAQTIGNQQSEIGNDFRLSAGHPLTAAAPPKRI
jgi:hypothetical protein